MKDALDMLKEKKQDIDELKAPEELEERLRTALTRTERKGSKRWLAAAIILVMFGVYSFDAVAYYGRKIMGYDKVIVGNLSELNELGKGQEIGESVTFSNGITVTIDGLFFDDNKLVVLHKVNGDLKSGEIGIPNLTLKGISTYFSRGGGGVMVGENLWVFEESFDPPAFYEKWMKVIITCWTKGNYEEREVSFKLDRNLAMNHVAKQDINEKVELDGIPITFESITASPLEIKIKGSLQKKQDNKEIPDHGSQLSFDLYINNKKIAPQGSGMSSKNEKDFDFENNFDGISEKVEAMKIVNIRLIDRDNVNKKIDLTYGTDDLKVDLGRVSMTIKEISFDGENTYIKIETPKNVEVPMGILIGNNSLEFVNSEFKDLGETDQWIHKFKGKGEGAKLAIKTVDFVKKSSKEIEIPID